MNMRPTLQGLGHSKIEATARYQTLEAEEAWAVMDELQMPPPDPGRFKEASDA